MDARGTKEKRRGKERERERERIRVCKCAEYLIHTMLSLLVYICTAVGSIHCHALLGPYWMEVSVASNYPPASQACRFRPGWCAPIGRMHQFKAKHLA